MRHLREVHGQYIQGQAPQTFMCPEPNCKRHHRGFTREYNMLEHHRRQHEGSVIENALLEETDSERKGDQMMSVRQGYSNSISGPGLVATDTFDVVHQHGQSSSETAFHVLQAELNELKAQKEHAEQALQTFDQQIVAISGALRVMEERLQSAVVIE